MLDREILSKASKIDRERGTSITLSLSATRASTDKDASSSSGSKASSGQRMLASEQEM